MGFPPGVSSLEWQDIWLHPAGESSAVSPNSEEDARPRPARIDSKGEEANGLVYRGVSNDRTPLRVVRDGPALIITSNADPHLDLSQLWLTEVRSDGTTSRRVLHPFNEETAFLVNTPARFTAEESSPNNLDALNDDLRIALRKAGLFAEEADALIATLDSAHSRRTGLRLFFLAPEKCASVASPARIRFHRDKKWPDLESTRVIVACLEIVTPEQRSLLSRIAAGREEQAVTGFPPKPETLTENSWQQLNEMYGWLGQFRNALLLDEQRRRPTLILEAFIKRFRLEGYTPVNEWLPKPKGGR